MTVGQLIKELKKFPANAQVGHQLGDQPEYEWEGFIDVVCNGNAVLRSHPEIGNIKLVLLR